MLALMDRVTGPRYSAWESIQEIHPGIHPGILEGWAEWTQGGGAKGSSGCGSKKL